MFHGTTISIIQHFVVPISSPPFRLNTTKADRCTKLSLPEFFPEIRPTPEVKPKSPRHTSLTVSGNQTKSMLNGSDTWLVVLGKDPEKNTRTQFSAFYLHQAMSPIKTGSHLLLLIPEPVKAPATLRRAVNIVHKISQNVNQGQISVITGDQPVYAIRKHLQRMFPTEFKDIVWMFRYLHIEQVFIKVIGDWLENTGWADVYVYANINSNGRADSFLTCSGDAGVKRPRYAHQLTLASLTTLGNEASKSQTGFTDFKAWKANLEKNSTTSKYWFTVTEVEKLLFIFLRSLRESKFDFFIGCFKEMLPSLAALDHIHYLR